ncbi:TspO/MBR family protein [Microvirga guangxiensis]|uniref:TspO and MBR related proteins n=1 Tax=Microvirga guangxiensis TaxID=549386 RepID=A0A1G5EJ21_9HYPH|nr:TspO/MBR family protein [Microvirga guangxiensis]SCY26955.1 TspO and MBR related proteins [Microvirga guangxiensis]
MHTDQTVPGSHATPPLPRFLIAVLPVVAVAVAGSLVTQPNIPTWYAGLAKPGFSPPNWLFAPVWTMLYAMMAYALWRILSLPRSTPGRTGAIVIFFVQLALNSAWSFAFFGAQSPLLGLVVIAALIVAILSTIAAFWKLDRVAALLFVPYLAWVCFATLLNGAIWQLNG